MTSSIPQVDVSPLFAWYGTEERRKQVAAELTAACHHYGFVAIVGHGVSSKRLREAFATSKSLFALPHEDKMKAPHPFGAIPHRGYSAPGREKVSKKEQAADASEDVRKIADYKKGKKINGSLRIMVTRDIHLISNAQESYEIGSEANKEQHNIWLPEDLLPGFREFSLELYWQLNEVGETLLEALATGLELTEDERQYLTKEIRSGNNNQLRLLHYPPVSKSMVEREIIARMPSHTDWSLFTMLFQESVGGLELQDPQTPGQFIKAAPIEGALVLNIGDMFERLTHGYFPSALHRVALPSPLANKDTDSLGYEEETPARYSIPYFFAPDDDAMIKTLESCLKGEQKKYEDVKFRDYSELRAKHSYVNNDSEKA